jgi:acyl-CoA synthetase (AMP-forming)/AMP-acid ligase II
MVIRGGENICCIEVENILTAHPAIADAALVGAHEGLGVPLLHVREGANDDASAAAPRSSLMRVDSPRSPIRKSPVAPLMKMLSHLRSRWMMPF